MSAYVDTAPFRAGARERKLLLQFCPVAQRFQHPPRPLSVYTGRRRLEWREVSGNGRIYAAAVLRVAAPGRKDALPFCYATVELDEGVRMLGKLLGCAP